MVWLKMDDQISHHPKFVAAGAIASWLWVCGNCHCNRYLTDGFIAENTLASLGVIPSPRKHAETLVKVGLWERVDQGYQVHDFLEHNPSREEVTTRRAEQHDAKVRGGQAASRQRQQKASSAASDVLEDESSRTIATRARVPSPPIPSPPIPSPPVRTEGAGSLISRGVVLEQGASPGRPPVPHSLHAGFLSRLSPPLSDSEAQADLDAFYAQVRTEWANRTILPASDFDFWRARFDEWKPDTGRTDGRLTARGEKNLAIAERWAKS